MHALQIDSISVVARSPYLVLWSRIGDYDPTSLDELLAEAALFEWWSHAACFIPMEAYPAYRRMMLEANLPWRRRTSEWLAQHGELVQRLLAQMRETGPVRSSDFARPDGEKAGGWWSWKDEKLALELLLTRGDVMIARREGFQRVYDLREHVLPDWDDSRTPLPDEAERLLVLSAVRALGVGRSDWVRSFYWHLRLPLRAVSRHLAALHAEGHLEAATVEGWTLPGYVHPANLAVTAKVPSRTTLLSPFDPLCRDRALALELFGFDYRIECYTPAAKRRYGYFSLPILHNDALVGRLDAKAHRQAAVFEVKALFLEPGVSPSDELVTGLRGAFHACAKWHRCPEVAVRWSEPAPLAALLSG
jgi:uncharacterized protein YcaQ